MKLRNIISAAALLCSLGSIAHAEGAPAPVVFSDSTQTPSYAIAAKLYGQYITAMPPGAKLQTAEIDLNHSGTASVVVRFVNSDACDANGDCHTSVLVYQNNIWNEVFAHKTATLAVASGPANVPAKLLVDGTSVWQPGPDHKGLGITYYPELNSYPGATTPIYPTKPASSFQAQAGRAAMFPKGIPSYLKDSNFSVAKLDVGGEPGTLYAVLDTAQPDCGDVGCPFAVVDQNGISVLSTISPGLFAISTNVTNGVADLIVSDYFGISIWSWDPNSMSYRRTSTSYSSKVTPIP